MQRSPIIPLLLGLAATVAHGQQQARIVKYHVNDIVSVRAKMRYTTLIQLPASEKILDVATGDKDFWITDTVANYCFVHPAKEGIHSSLNLITDKGNVYSFSDLKTLREGEAMYTSLEHLALYSAWKIGSTTVEKIRQRFLQTSMRVNFSTVVLPYRYPVDVVRPGVRSHEADDTPCQTHDETPSAEDKP